MRSRDVASREWVVHRHARAVEVSKDVAECRDERLERLERSLQVLKPDEREAVRLSRLEGLRTKEIAERLEKSESAVKSLLFRALRKLKESFGDTESLHLPEPTPGGEEAER